MLVRPEFVSAGLAEERLNFPWSNGIAVRLTDWDLYPRSLAMPVWAMNFKAMAALGLAGLEWTLWRFEGHADITDGLARVEAGWVMLARPDWVADLGFSDIRDDVHQRNNPAGPIQSCLSALDHLCWAFMKGRPGMGLAVLPALRLPSLVRSKGYRPWLERAFAACAEAYPVSPEFDSRGRFYDHAGEPPVPRAWFDSLSAPADPAANEQAWATFLARVDRASNPYLRG